MASERTVMEVRSIIGEALGVSDRARSYDAHTALLGAIPEFDSMAVVSVVTLIEERFDIEISDDDLEADTFASIGTLADLVESKLGG